MASACCRETAMRLPPSAAQPRPSPVTATEVRPIRRLSKMGIALPCRLRIGSVQAGAYTVLTLVREAARGSIFFRTRHMRVGLEPDSGAIARSGTYLLLLASATGARRLGRGRVPAGLTRPASANCEPLRLVRVRSPQAKEQLLFCV